MRKLALLVLLLVTPAHADELVDSARVCFTQFATRPLDVQPGSPFKKGYENCSAIVSECVKTRPNCVEAADLKVQEDKANADKKRIDDLAGKLRR